MYRGANPTYYYPQYQQQQRPQEIADQYKIQNIYDPVNDIFVDYNSENGRLIRKNNDMCDKCGVSEVFDILNAKCKSIKIKTIAKKYKDEIEYCSKYNKKIRKLARTESKILDNILNIKLPGGKGALKDYIPEYPNIKPKNKKLSTNIGLKDKVLSKIVNFSPIILFTVYKIAAENPELAKYLAKKIIEIISDSNGAIGSFFTKVILKNINFGSMKAIVSGLSFSKFLQFFTGLVSVITSFSLSKKTKTSGKTPVSTIFDDYTDKFSSSVFEGDLVKIDKTNMDPVSLSDLERKGLLTGQNLDKISLSVLGIKSQDMVKMSNQTGKGLSVIKGGVDISEGVPYIIIRTANKDKRINILPEISRKSELKTAKDEIKLISSQVEKILENSQKSIDAIILSNQIKNKESQLKFQIESRENPKYRKPKEIEREKELTKELSNLKQQDYEAFGKKGSKGWVEQRGNSMDQLEISKRLAIISKKNIENLAKEIQGVNQENYNYYRSQIIESLRNIKNNIQVSKEAGISYVKPAERTRIKTSPEQTRSQGFSQKNIPFLLQEAIGANDSLKKSPPLIVPSKKNNQMSGNL